MLAFIGGVVLAIALWVFSENFPVVGTIATVIAAFFYPFLWILVAIQVGLMIFTAVNLNKNRY